MKNRLAKALLAAAIVGMTVIGLTTPANATATWTPTPVTSYVTTYTGGPLAVTGNACPQSTGACATVVLAPEVGATFHWQLKRPDGTVASGATTSNVLKFGKLASDAVYNVREYATQSGRTNSGWSTWTPIDTKTCANPGSSTNGYGPEADLVARTVVWDGSSWRAWVNAHASAELSNSFQYSFVCEADNTLVSDIYVVEYLNLGNVDTPITGFYRGNLAIWNLAAP